jgi:hypothetical protein
MHEVILCLLTSLVSGLQHIKRADHPPGGVGPPELRGPGTEGGKMGCLGREFDCKTPPKAPAFFALDMRTI